MPEPYFSVVIPTHNRVEMLSRVLSGLAAQESPPPFETIVVDDGSSDATAVRLDQWSTAGHFPFPFSRHSQRNSGPGAARNRGVEMAGGRYVVFLGDDTVPRRQFLAQHARIHSLSGEDPQAACLGYTGWPPGQRVTAFMDYINDYGLQFGYKLIRDGAEVPFNFFYTSNLSLSRELLRSHPFDTTFPAAAWEDIELAYRLRETGLRIIYSAAAVADHYHPMTIDSFARRQYIVGRSGAIFHKKHPELDHFLGIHELRSSTLLDDHALEKVRRAARRGERFRFLARPQAFEVLMRQHYLRGLRDGLAERAGKSSETATHG